MARYLRLSYDEMMCKESTMPISAILGPTALASAALVQPSAVPAPEPARVTPQAHPAEAGPAQPLSSAMLEELIRQQSMLYGSYSG